MKLAYQKTLAEYDLKIEDLPNDLQEDIKEIHKIADNIKRIKGRGQKPTASVMDQLTKRDRLLISDLEDFYEEQGDEMETENNNDNKSHEQKMVSDEGATIEGELDNLYKSGKKTITGSEMRAECPKCYKKIFSTYDKGGDNGIKTSRYAFIEVKETPETFNLTTR